MEWEELPRLFPELEPAGAWLPLLQRHAELVTGAQPGVRVTSDGPAEWVRRHYAESLEMLRIAESGRGLATTVVDVGSGGGWPGLIVAAVHPAVPVALVEPLKKRAALLEAWARELGLAEVEVVAERGEDAGRGRLRGTADLVMARAVAELRVVLEYTAPLAVVGGRIALAKGSAASRELAAAANALSLLGCEVEGTVSMRPEVSEHGVVVLVRKVTETDERYPRRPGVASKRPL
ncbi:MAG: RsmG family class I SAM-dependent methyltransferase [Dehalococcoidia bacterium]